jgi:hypothetical protein
MRKLLVTAAVLAVTQLSPLWAADRATDNLIERAEKAFASQLAQTHTTGRGEDADALWIAKDAVYQYALNGIGASLRLEGRAVITAHLSALADAAPSAAIESIRFFPTIEPDLVFVQYALVPVDGVGKRSNSLAIIQMRGDQIAKFTQLNRTPETLQALKALSGPVN